MLAWDNVRFLDRQRHRPSRRRWSLALRERAEYCANWSPDLISDRTAKKPKVTSRLTKKDIESAQKLLQLQTDGFVRSLEIQSLRNSVSQLLGERRRAEDGFREFRSELRALERHVLTNKASTVLDYSLSEQDWVDIIER